MASLTGRSLTAAMRRTLAAAGLISALVLSSESGGAAALEYAVKATFLYKFALFVQWPSAPDRDRPLTLCLSGSDAVTDLVPSAAAGQTVDGRRVAIVHVPEQAPLEDCQILYIAASPQAEQILAAASGKPILTVTDGAIGGHGIIAFVVVDGHVRFDVDDRLAADAHLVISSQLLGLAHAVIPRPRSDPP